jgi:hypothetical protein
MSRGLESAKLGCALKLLRLAAQVSRHLLELTAELATVVHTSSS